MRRDTCRLLVSGVIGADPKETFLAIDNNFVLNFPLAVVGHFSAIHDWERYKPTETMWLSCEVWNDEARAHQSNMRKGAPLSGLATLIFNRWTDKVTNEERKMIKARFTNILSKEDLADMLGSSGIEDMSPSGNSGFADELPGGSGFANESPRDYDQSPPPAALGPPATKRVMRGPASRPAAAPAPAPYASSAAAAPVAPRPAPRRNSRELDEDLGRGPTIPF